MTLVRGSCAQVLDEVVAGHVRLVADRDERGQADVQLARVVQDRQAERAALRRHRHAAGGRRDGRKRGAQSHGGVGIDEPHAIRSHHADAGAADPLEQFRLEFPTCGAGFSEARRDHDDGLDLLFDAVVDDGIDEPGRHRNDDQIDVAGHVGDAPDGRDARDVRRRRMHGNEAARVAGRDHVVQQFRADLAALATGADDGDRARFEEVLHRGGGGRFRTLGGPILVGLRVRERQLHAAEPVLQPPLGCVPGIEEHLHHRVIVATHPSVERADVFHPRHARQHLEHPGADAPALERRCDREQDFRAIRGGVVPVIAGDRGDVAAGFADHHERSGWAARRRPGLERKRTHARRRGGLRAAGPMFVDEGAQHRHVVIAHRAKVDRRPVPEDDVGFMKSSHYGHDSAVLARRTPMITIDEDRGIVRMLPVRTRRDTSSCAVF